jgi:hypothetical protein
VNRIEWLIVALGGALYALGAVSAWAVRGWWCRV